MKEIYITDKDTGNCIVINKDTNVEIKSSWADKHIGKFNFDDNGICNKMPQEYTVPEKEEDEEDLDYMPIRYDRFSRTNQVECPKFSKKTYASIWLSLVSHLDFWTNAIYTKWLPNGRRIYAHNKEDLMEVTEVSQASLYRFYSDIFKRNYVAEWSSAKLGKVYVLNPKFVMNGGKILSEVYYLFNPDEIPGEPLVVNKDGNTQIIN